MKNNKEKNARLVTFNEDYPNSETPIYRKGQTAAMHYKLADKLKKNKAKVDVKEVDVEAVVKRRKRMLADNMENSLAK